MVAARRGHWGWRWLRVEAQPTESGCQGVFLDATAQCDAEQHARTRQILQIAVDAMPQCAFWKDLQGRYLGCNRAFAEDAGLSGPAEIIGKTDFELVWRGHAHIYRENDARIIATGAARRNVEEPFQSRGRGQIWVRASKIPRRGAGGPIPYNR